jgi:hypothetical protein
MLTQNTKRTFRIFATILVVALCATQLVSWGIQVGNLLGSETAGWITTMFLLAVIGVLLFEFSRKPVPTLALATATPGPVPKRAYRKRAEVAEPPTAVIDKSIYLDIKGMNISQARKARAANRDEIKAQGKTDDLVARKVAITAHLKSLGDGTGKSKKADPAKRKAGRPRKPKE